MRQGRDGEIKNSKPCEKCIDTMLRYNIKRVYWTTDSGGIEFCNPVSIPNPIETNAQKNYKKKNIKF